MKAFQLVDAFRDVEVTAVTPGSGTQLKQKHVQSKGTEGVSNKKANTPSRDFKIHKGVFLELNPKLKR